MNAADPGERECPKRLDDALYAEMINTVGERLAMPAVDACWRAINRAGFVVAPSVRRELERRQA